MKKSHDQLLLNLNVKVQNYYLSIRSGLNSVDVDNHPLEMIDDEINDDELLDCAKDTLQIEKQEKPKSS